MITLRVLLLFILSGCVLSDGETLLESCYVEDRDCLSKTTEQFLSKTFAGIPAYDIKPLDPMLIPSLDYEVNDGIGLVFHFKNINITGLKNQRIYDFKMDTVQKSVLLTTQFELQIKGDISFDFVKQSKVYSGSYTASGPQYNYELKTIASGVEHFDVGPETITCDVPGQLQAHVRAPQLDAADDKECSEIWQLYENKKATLDKEVFCAIVKEAYGTVVHNIRAAAKVLPKTAFFKNV